jgi:spore coat polysaccharide biosynthesis protein SpsF
VKTGFFITARLKSSRLKLKLLLKLHGREIIRHVIDRVKQVSGIDTVVLCTSTDPQDRVLVDIALEEGIYYYTGDGTDVLRRLYDAAHFFGVDHFLSVTADNPFFSIYQANRLSNHIRLNPATDYAYTKDIPIGGGLYALRTGAVSVVCQIKQANDTEIWGPFINKPDFFNVFPLEAENAWAKDCRLTVDEACDYEFAVELLRKSGLSVLELDLFEIDRTVAENPALLNINSNIVQRALSPDLQNQIDRIFSEQEIEIRQLITDSRQQRAL